MKNESVKKSIEKSKNILEEKRKMVKRKICIKNCYTFTIIAMNFVQEQLKKKVTETQLSLIGMNQEPLHYFAWNRTKIKIRKS